MTCSSTAGSRTPRRSTRPGPQLIGRTGDLWVPVHLQRAGIKLEDQQTLWDPHTRGNIQVLDKWAPVVNDCWVLGDVHRRADFDLVSARTLKNVWDFDKGFHVVTAREILGLVTFGYAVKQQPSGVRLVCTDVSKAQGATIQAYDALTKGNQQIGADSIRSILVMDPRSGTRSRASIDRVCGPASRRGRRGTAPAKRGTIGLIVRVGA
jgi:hypothetical protein